MIENIRINWIEESEGYVAACIVGDEVIFSAFDISYTDAYFSLIEMLCLNEMREHNKKQCMEYIEDYAAFME